jgi:hypothetical protein
MVNMKRSAELVRLKRFCEIVAAALPSSGEAGEQMRVELLRAIATITSMKAARTIVSDLLEWTQDLAGNELFVLDQSLAAQALPTLSLMRSREDAQLAAILQSGFIASEDEYRLVSSRLADTAGPLSDADRALANQLVAAFVP